MEETLPNWVEPRLSRSLFFLFGNHSQQCSVLTLSFCCEVSSDSAQGSYIYDARNATRVSFLQSKHFHSCSLSHPQSFFFTTPLVLLILCCLIQESHPQVMWVMTCFQITSACPLICKEGIMLFILLFPGAEVWRSNEMIQLTTNWTIERKMKQVKRNGRHRKCSIEVFKWGKFNSESCIFINCVNLEGICKYL